MDNYQNYIFPTLNSPVMFLYFKQEDIVSAFSILMIAHSLTKSILFDIIGICLFFIIKTALLKQFPIFNKFILLIYSIFGFNKKCIKDFPNYNQRRFF